MHDAIQLELVRNALATIAEEMGLAVVRSAYSSHVKEGGDSTAALFDARGQLLAQSNGAPLMHLASLRPSLAEVIIEFPTTTMREGDVFASNDPYRGGIHSNDVMVFRPVFVDGAVTFFTASLLHVADLGGVATGGLPANATEMYHEGLVLPPVRLYRGGEPEQGILATLAANSRTPEKVLGDVRAMVAGDNVGATRLAELAGKYGRARLIELCDELLAYSERRTRLEIAALPDGTHTGSFTIDDDGVEVGKDHVVRVKVTIDGDRFIADFTGTARQARGPINAARSQSISGAFYAMRCLLSPDIPVNEGAFAPLELVLPPGTLVNPNRPAACNSRMATVMAIVEAMLSACREVDPRTAVAASCNTHVYIMSGHDADGQVWAYIDPQFGGGGARNDRDGIDVTGPLIFAMGGAFHCVEAYELEYPVRFERFSYWQDSGGPGEWRGGLGSRREIRVLTDAVFTGRASDRTRLPPPGVEGGRSGRGGGWIVNEGTPDALVLPAKVTSHELAAGEVVTMLTSGGGGFGRVEDRDEQLVLDDVLDGRISVAVACDDYGVAVDVKGKRVDRAATVALRKRSA